MGASVRTWSISLSLSLALHGLGSQAFVAPRAAPSCRPAAACRSTGPGVRARLAATCLAGHALLLERRPRQHEGPFLSDGPRSVAGRSTFAPLCGTRTGEHDADRIASGAASDAGAALLRPPARGPTLHAYVFVTIVGWGKNTLLDEMLPEIRGRDPCPTWHLGGGADGSDEGSLPGLFEGPELQAPTVLESDTLGPKRFWSAVEDAVCDDDKVHHLFLNKNFPPNAWQGAKRRLLEYCKTANRALILYAIVPNSPGTERNAFHLVDLGVCLSAVQSRAEHPNLGKDSQVTASVAATFYNLYYFRGGRQEFRDRLKSDLTNNVIEVDWLDPAAYARAPATLSAKMEELLVRMGQARRNAKSVK
jgi:hypothetical protein